MSEEVPNCLIRRNRWNSGVLIKSSRIWSVSYTHLDAPYLTPIPYRGKKNEPGFTKFVVDAIAKLKNVDAELVTYKTFHNAERLFLTKREPNEED